MSGEKRSRLRRLVQRISRSDAANSRVPKTAVVVFHKADGEVIAEGVVDTHTTVLAAAAQLEVDFDHFCGGQGACGTCRLKIVRGGAALSKMEPKEALVLGSRAQSNGDRLACQARVMGDVEFTVPRWF
jgi:2Fe-2S ferredoxin